MTYSYCRYLSGVMITCHSSIERDVPQMVIGLTVPTGHDRHRLVLEAEGFRITYRQVLIIRHKNLIPRAPFLISHSDSGNYFWKRHLSNLSAQDSVTTCGQYMNMELHWAVWNVYAIWLYDEQSTLCLAIIFVLWKFLWIINQKGGHTSTIKDCWVHDNTSTIIHPYMIYFTARQPLTFY